jgi:hypothetical protein
LRGGAVAGGAELRLVVCHVKGDDRELFRSKLLKTGKPAQINADVAGVKTLELITEDGGDSNRGDWGIWVNPKIAR